MEQITFTSVADPGEGPGELLSFVDKNWGDPPLISRCGSGTATFQSKEERKENLVSLVVEL